MKKYILGAIFALSFAGIATPTMAVPIDTFSGIASFSDTSPVANNPVAFTGVFANPLFIFNPTSVGQTYTDTLFVTATDTTLRNTTFSDNIGVSLNFFLPNSASGTIGGTGSVTSTFFGLFDNGTLTWSAPSIISFADGSILTASMENFSVSGVAGIASGSGDLTLKLTKAPNAATTAVPEPFTMSIFGAGLIGAGVMRRRRKKAQKV